MNKWYTNLKKAPWSPPSYIFGIVWPILYAMMAVSFFLVWNNQKCFPYCSALTTFLIQLAFNLSWTTIFFYYKMPKLAFLDILIIQYFTIQTYYEFLKVNKLAAYLLLPYLSWLLVAFSLNLYIILNN
jgi:tryptophan-rich sensory protein